MPADFSKYSNYSKENSFSSIRFGADAPLLETELNEMQQIQTERFKDYVNSMHGNIVLEEGQITYENNQVTISNYTLLIDGEIVYVSNLSTSASDGDSIYIKIERTEIKYSDVLRKYGNKQEGIIENKLWDERVNQETSRRIAVTYDITTSTPSNMDEAIKMAEIIDGKLVKSYEVLNESKYNIIKTYEDIISVPNDTKGQISGVEMKGRTATNLIENGSFEDNFNKWTFEGSQWTIETDKKMFGDKCAKLSVIEESRYLYKDNMYLNSEHKYYLTFWTYCDVAPNNNNKILLSDSGSYSNALTISAKICEETEPLGEWIRKSYIFQPLETKFYRLALFGGSRVTLTVNIDGIMLIDLTELGLEDKTADEINEMFPYYFEGTKSTVSACRIKSVGKNLFESTLNGWIKDAGGALTFNDSVFTYKRTSGDNFDEIYKFFKVIPNQPYTLQLNILSITNGIRVRVYDKTIDGTLLGGTSFGSIGLKTITFTPQTEDVVIAFGGSYANSECSFNFVQLEKGDQATDYEPYKESNAYVIATDKDTGKILELRSLPNGTKDEIDTTQGKLIKRISDEYTIKATDIGSFNRDLTNVDQVTVRLPPDFVKSHGMGKFKSELREVDINDRDNINSIGALSNFGDGTLRYIIEKGTTLEQAKQQLVGTTLIYQLAEPEIIPVHVEGTLQAYKNGTIYFEPALSGKIIFAEGENTKQITTEELPIESIRKVLRYDTLEDGTIREVDVTEDCTHTDTTITINNVIPNVTYFYDCDIPSEYSTSGEKIITLAENIPANVEELIDYKVKNENDKRKISAKLLEHDKEIARVENDIFKEEYTELETYKDIINVPADAVKGQISGVELRGRTYTQILSYSSYEEWKVYGDTTIESNGIKFADGSTGYANRAQLAIPKDIIKTSDKWGLLYYAYSNATLHVATDQEEIYQAITNINVGYNKEILNVDTSKSGSIYFRIWKHGTAEQTISDIRLIQLTPDIEKDFNTMTAEQLILKYSFITGTKSTISARVKSIGRNLFPDTMVQEMAKANSTRGTVSFENNKIKFVSTENDAFINNHAVNRQLPVNFRKYAIRIPAGTVYYKRTIEGLTAGNTNEYVFYYDANYNYISHVNISHSSNGIRTSTLTVPSNAYYAVFRVGAHVAGQTIYYSNFMLSKENIDYEPYTESVIYTPADMMLRSLPNGVKDEITINEGKLIKRVSDELVLNGSESWSQVDNTTYSTDILRFDINIPDVKPSHDYSVLSDKFISGAYNDGGTYWNTVENIRAHGSQTIIHVFINKSRLATADVAGFKAWLTANPVTVIYQLAEPEYIPLNIPYQPLVAYPNGTIYFEPCLSGRITFAEGENTKEITSEDLPIQNINKVIEYTLDNGVVVSEKDITSECSHTSTTITIPNASPDKVYFYDCDIPAEYSTSAYKKLSFTTNTKTSLETLIKDTNRISGNIKAIESSLSKLNNITSRDMIVISDTKPSDVAIWLEELD